jgi:hypothetical protein
MTTRKFQGPLYIVILIFFASCAPNTMYSWNGYDQAVLDYYKNPNEREKYIEALSEIIVEAESSGNVPPGLYAEYGYVYFEDRNFDQAIIYFEKEHAVWPESRIFMNKMIRNANLQKKQGDKNTENSKNSTGNSP